MAARCKQKLVLLYFVMAAYICFSVYLALDIFSKKKVVYVAKCFCCFLNRWDTMIDKNGPT